MTDRTAKPSVQLDNTPFPGWRETAARLDAELAAERQQREALEARVEELMDVVGRAIVNLPPGKYRAAGGPDPNPGIKMLRTDLEAAEAALATAREGVLREAEYAIRSATGDAVNLWSLSERAGSDDEKIDLGKMEGLRKALGIVRALAASPVPGDGDKLQFDPNETASYVLGSEPLLEDFSQSGDGWKPIGDPAGRTAQELYRDGYDDGAVDVSSPRWQFNMATVPPDGTRMLLYYEGCPAFIGYRDKDNGEWYDDNGNLVASIDKPRAWASLPTPPSPPDREGTVVPGEG